MSQDRIPLIVDDDGSQDGMTALAFMLANPKFDVQAVTISQGIANPPTFASNLAKMLRNFRGRGISEGAEFQRAQNLRGRRI